MLNITGGSDPADSDRLLIDIPKNELGTFLCSLLGQARHTKKVYRKPFLIDHDFLRNLDAVIDQRVARQQRSELTAFNATVHFADGRSQTETSRESFHSFNDLSRTPTTGIDIVWTYLVWFPISQFQRNKKFTFVWRLIRAAT